MFIKNLTNIIHNEYNLKSIYKLDNLEDFDIYFKNQRIGLIQVVNQDIPFLRQIRIDDEFKRCGHAKAIIEYYQNTYDKVQLCISTHSSSAIAFWDNYLTHHKHSHIRGDIYELIKE